jgi:CDP-diglyceride synthetase
MDNHDPMITTPHSQAKRSALYACFYLGIIHYAVILQLSTANFTQNISFIPPLFALLAGSHASIGFVSGYIAGKHHYSSVFNAILTVFGFLSGLLAAFAVVAILTSLVETTQPPLAQHMLAYATTLGGFGAGTSFVTGMLYTLVRQQHDA